MPIQVALYSKQIGGKTFAFDTGDISYGDAGTKEVPINVGVDVLTVTLRKRQVTFTIRGATGADLQNLYTERDNVITQLINATAPVTGEDIQIGEDIIYSALLKDVQAGPPINVGGRSIIEQLTVVYDSTVFV